MLVILNSAAVFDSSPGGRVGLSNLGISIYNDMGTEVRGISAISNNSLIGLCNKVRLLAVNTALGVRL